LETLAKYKNPETDERIPLTGIDMSTKTHGGKWDELPKTKIRESEFVNWYSVRERVYLQGLNLSKKTLGYQVQLNNANFSGAALQEARFEGAILLGANFEGADLWEAKFEGARLWEARFEGAILWWAKFEGANLLNANFEGANLRWANFEGAKNVKSADFGKYNILHIFDKRLSLIDLPSSFDDVERKILLKDQDENDSNSWEEFNEEKAKNDFYQRFNNSKGEYGKDELIKDNLGGYLKIKILNNDEVKKAFEAGKIKPNNK